MQENSFHYVDGGVVAAKGFVASGISAGIKKSGARDLALIVAKEPCPAAAVFTRSSMAAAPVVYSRESIASGMLKACIINSGNANACTGVSGMADVRATAASVARLLECDASQVVVSSTGVIGVPLPLDPLLNSIPEAVAALDYASGDDAAQAIMTTDTFVKQIAVSIQCAGRTYTVGGMAKGSGMIMPNMATMLGVLTCDAPLTSHACDTALRTAVATTFNRITVDSDTSTNDMVLLMASGAAGGEAIGEGDECFRAVASAIREVCGELARMIVKDGEGATTFITVTVRGALSEEDALDAAMSIANSPLFKTAIYGNDANWGRVAMAVGKSKAHVAPDRLEVIFAGIPVCRDGMAIPFDEKEALAALSQPEVEVVADLHLGDGEATVWTCDLSHEYVKINGEYRT